MSFAGSNALHIKQHNMRAVLQSLLQKGPLSRVQLAAQTALSNTTITNLTSELLELEIICEEEPLAGQNGQRRRGVGRPRRMLRLIPNARYVVGVHIGIGILRVAVTNLYAEVLHNKMDAFAVEDSATAVLDLIVRLVEQTVAEAGVERALILGVGVGASGLVDPQTGVNVLAARLGWRHTPIRAYLETRLNLPVCVDNNVRAMALGEAVFGAGQGVGLLAFIYGRVGVGAGIVLGGRVFRGGGAGAGEIGHVIIVPEGGKLCGCGQYGCLETLVAEPVLVQEAELRVLEDPDGCLAHFWRRPDLRPIEAIFAAARAGDPPTVQMIERLARYLGLALANLVNVLNPELIILGGMFAQGSDLILPTAEATMRNAAFADLGKKVCLQPTGFGWRAGIIGASALALTHFFYEAAL
jgi:glucokinase-like ROK family protein